MANGKSLLDDRIQPVEKKRIHDQISEQINAMIEEGLLKPGDQLPSERDLAERFKVSRNSVRDALRTLEAKGFLVIQQGGGTYVREVPTADLYQTLMDVLIAQKEHIRSILQVRQIIEPGVAYAAVKNATPEYIARLEEVLAIHEAKSEIGDPGIEEDSLFHNIIAQMTGNNFLIMVLQVIQESIESTRDLLIKYSGSSTRIGHRRIVQALKEHNPEAARDAMKAHLDEVLKAYELYEAEQESGDAPAIQ
jgi:GntR family transcriptional repressor for pyruvate dehydrogenase complex